MSSEETYAKDGRGGGWNYVLVITVLVMLLFSGMGVSVMFVQYKSMRTAELHKIKVMSDRIDILIAERSSIIEQMDIHPELRDLEHGKNRIDADIGTRVREYNAALKGFSEIQNEFFNNILGPDDPMFKSYDDILLMIMNR